ncbi:MAG TPA: Fic family protein, partial [Blastocatellia bacterium]|nr:Fic family protein [Blastocatellia bacterium]
MRIDDNKYLNEWLEAAGGRERIVRLWDDFKTLPHPPLDFSTEASAVFSAQIEGNTIDLDSFMNSKLGQTGLRAIKPKELAEIESLIEAYRLAQSQTLDERNLLAAHDKLAEPILPAATRGRYRTQLMFVYSRDGIKYAAVEPAFVQERMKEAFVEIDKLKRAGVGVVEAFYHAALAHLVLAHIHPFADGNGRAARLLEKWLLAELLADADAWLIP